MNQKVMQKMTRAASLIWCQVTKTRMTRGVEVWPPPPAVVVEVAVVAADAVAADAVAADAVAEVAPDVPEEVVVEEEEEEGEAAEVLTTTWMFSVGGICTLLRLPEKA